MKAIAACLLLLLSVSCATSRSKFDPRADTSQASSGAVEASFSSAGSTQKVPGDLLKTPTNEFQLGPGDKLDIEILGETGSRAETFITPDSKVYFNLLPGLDVGGLTATQLKKLLEDKLTKFYRNPQVSVNLLDVRSQRVWVLGRLNQPGVYPIKQPMRVMDAITMAGGLFASRFSGTTEELADLEHSFLVRKGQVLPVNFQKLIREGDMSQNIYLQANDYVYLPSSLTNEVYVLGAVKEPQPVGFMNDMNLVAALGKGRGVTADADLSRVSIIRGALTDPKIAIVDAGAILKGKATNVRLQPGDIVYVPTPRTMSAGSYAKDAVNTFVRVVAANEGGNAVLSDSPNVGVNINLGQPASN